MHHRRTIRRGLRMLRRSAALGLGLCALWLLSLTGAYPSPGALVRELGGQADFVVETFSAQLPFTPLPDSTVPDRLGNYVLAQSPLLSCVREQVQQRLAAPAPQTPAAPVDIGDNEEDSRAIPQPLPDTPVVEHTALGRDDGSCLNTQQVYLQNQTDQQVDIAALAVQPLQLSSDSGPQILIYHTHGSEAYTQTQNSRYVESDSYRTTDCTKNVVRVGKEMAAVFREMGFEVIHDTTLYDYPAYSGAYERSRAGVERHLEQYPSIRFVLDVHRDALVGEDGTAYKLIAQEGEEKVAQVMLVVGSNDGGAHHPDWQDNLALAVQMQLALTRQYSQLARPIVLRSTRYNQDITTGSLLVEVGGHGNTLEEALAGGRMFARTAGELLAESGLSTPAK